MNNKFIDAARYCGYRMMISRFGLVQGIGYQLYHRTYRNRKGHDG